MIDLTPLDVRNKRGDFKKGMRGYDPQEVDVFLELVAERLEALVRENIQFRDRTRTLEEQVNAQTGREQAVQDALVTAQELRKDIREQSQREAAHVMREAESEARRMIAEADAEVRSRLRDVERQIDHLRSSIQELERRRSRFLQDFRTMLQRELDFVDVEEDRTPLEEQVIDLELGAARASKGGPGGDPTPTVARSAEAPVADEAANRGATPEHAVEAQPESGEAPGASAGASRGDAGTADTGSEVADRPAADADRPAADADRPAADADRPAADADRPAADADHPAADADHPAADAGPGSEAAAAPSRSAAPEHETTVDVADLHPEAPGEDQPTSLEVELMAGAAGMTGADGKGEGSPDSTFPDVPDLETVLAEAGIDDPSTSEEISPPPADRPHDDRRGADDPLALFERDDEDPQKKR